MTEYINDQGKTLAEHEEDLQNRREALIDALKEDQISPGKARELFREADPSYEKLMQAFNRGC